MNDNKQTAVEYLINQLERIGFSTNNIVEFENEIQIAKEMEKQQIMMAVTDSWYMAKGSDFQELQAEQYYNEEYGKG